MAEFEGESQGSVTHHKKGQVFGMPWWAIGVAIAAAVLLFVMWRRAQRNAAQAQTGTDQTQYLVGGEDTSQQVAGLPPGAIGDYLNSNPTNPAYPVGLTPMGVPSPVTNQQWARLAADTLIGMGEDPSLVATALAKFISGGSLSAAEQAVINKALELEGQPPEGVIPVLGPGVIPPITNPIPDTGGTGVTGGSPQAPAPAPAPERRYVIVAKYTTVAPPWNSTLSGIAAHYGTTVANLAAINHIANPNLIITGQKIYIDP